MAKGTKVKNEWDVIAESEIANVGQNIGKVIEAIHSHIIGDADRNAAFRGGDGADGQ